MNTILRSALWLFLLFPNACIFAQQEPVATFFESTLMHTNPATTGASYKHAANAVWKDYWTKNQITGTPYQMTIWGNYAMRIDPWKSGIGVSYRYDAFGHQKRSTALLSYAYHIPIKELTLSIGASGGLNTVAYDYSKTNALQSYSFNPAFTADAGVMLHKERWHVGISATQLNRPIMRSTDQLATFVLEPTYWLHADYRFQLGTNWSLTPKLQMVTDFVKGISNFQVQTAWKEQLWFGVAWKSQITDFNNYTIAPMIGYDIKGKFRLGYLANISSYIGVYSNRHVMHEVVLSFLLK